MVGHDNPKINLDLIRVGDMVPGRGTGVTIKDDGEDDGEAAEDRDQEEAASGVSVWGREGPQQTVRACSGNEAGQVLTCAREDLSVTGQVAGVFFCNSGG